MLDIMKQAFAGGEAMRISRRDALIAPAAVAATAALAPFRAAQAAGHAETTYLPPSEGRVRSEFFAFDDPLDKMTAEFRIYRDLADEADVLLWYHFTMFIVAEGRRVEPVIRYEGIELSHQKRIDTHVYRVHGHNTSYPRHPVTGEFIDRVNNPVTGETVKAPPTILTEDPGMLYSPEGKHPLDREGEAYTPTNTVFRIEDDIVKAEQVRVPPDNWLTPFIETSHNWTPKSLFEDPSITRLPMGTSGGLVLCAVVLGGIEYFSDPVFWQRYLNPPADPMEPGPDFYQPEFSLNAPSTAFFPTAGEPAIDPGVLKAAVAWTEQTAGTALLVLHRGEIQIEHYWREGGAGELMTGRAMTKTLNALLAGAAIGDGFLELDDRIGDYIDEWANAAQGDITLRELLYHASGLENPPIGPGAWNKMTRSAWTGDVVMVALDHALEREPGSVFDIGNVTSQLVAITIEQAIGRPIQEYFLERIWRPIGADRGSFFMDRADGMIHIDCCFRTTPHNWVRLGALVLNDGMWNGERVLPDGWVATMSMPSPRNANYGMHIWLGREFVGNRPYSELREIGVPHSEPFLRDDIVFFEGGGYRNLYIIPSEDMVILRLGKRHPDWDASYLPNTLIRGIIETASGGDHLASMPRPRASGSAEVRENGVARVASAEP